MHKLVAEFCRSMSDSLALVETRGGTKLECCDTNNKDEVADTIAGISVWIFDATSKQQVCQIGPTAHVQCCKE